MMRPTGYALHKCECGWSPNMRVARSSEDSMVAWVECPKCGMHTDDVDDAYADTLTAAHLWNDGKRQQVSRGNPDLIRSR